MPATNGSIRAAIIALAPLPMAVVDLDGSTNPLSSPVVAANKAMDRLLVKPGGTIVGRVVDDFVLPDRRRIASEHLTLMASSSLEGYNVQAQIRHGSGHVLEMPTWVKRLRLDDSLPLAAIVVAPQDLTTKPLDVLTTTSESSGAAFIVTDHDWRVEHRSHKTDVFLNYEPLEGSGAGVKALGEQTSSQL